MYFYAKTEERNSIHLIGGEIEEKESRVGPITACSLTLSHASSLGRGNINSCRGYKELLSHRSECRSGTSVVLRCHRTWVSLPNLSLTMSPHPRVTSCLALT